MATCFIPDSNMPVAEVLRLFILDRLAEFERTTVRLSDTNRDTAIDAVHDLRVICRQILSLITAFSPYVRAERLRPLKKNIGQINGFLGPVRDLDVLLTRSELGKELHVWIEQKRMDLFSELIHACSGQKLQKKMTDMREPLLMPDADIRLAPTAITDKGKVQMRRLGLVVPEILYRLAADVVAYQTIVRPPDPEQLLLPSTDSLHRLRISCKQFRYAVTLLQPLFGSQADALIQSFKSLQDVLGRLHDLQILTEVIESYNKKAAPATADTALSISIQQSCSQLLAAFSLVWQPIDQVWMHQQLRPLIDALYQTGSHDA